MTLPDFVRSSLMAAAAQYLTDCCTIRADALTPNAYGGTERSAQVVAENVRCRVITTGQKSGASSALVAGQETLAQEYKLAVGPEVALAVDQSVEVGGETYQIVRLETALTERFFRSAIMVRR
jgi:hypothetical protein